MESLQERTNDNRVLLDKWSTREQLCLASAVASYGDQNWITVSRAVRVVCGKNRPSDWFSHKSCAVQYEDLMERNKCAVNEDEMLDASLENTDLVTQLVNTRLLELKANIRKEQEEYAKICSELKSLKSDSLSIKDLQEMWNDIEKEQEMQRIEEMKLENQMREREQRNQDMQRNWRGNVVTPNYPPLKMEENISLQGILGSNKTTYSGGGGGNIQQGTSPLLSSLLKSPTPSCASPTLGTTAHVTAPTITTLLTGGAINENQPAITLKNTMSTSEAAQMLTRPISGPPTECLSVAGNPTHNLLSPSQSAPTLSMLLEKNKATNVTTTVPSTETATTTVEPAKITETAVSQSVFDSNNEEVPMDIEEELDASAGNTADTIDSDTDANEEQQLLEVFKNIGNIDDLEDIDVAAVINEEVDFLKAVEGEHTGREQEHEEDEEMKMETENENKNDNASNHSIIKTESEISMFKTGELLSDDDKQKEFDNIKEEKNEENVIETKDDFKIETLSSDDSNDDIPLSTLGTNNTSYSDKENNKSYDEQLDVLAKEEHDIDEAIPTDEEQPTTQHEAASNLLEVGQEVGTAVEKELELNVTMFEKSPQSNSSDVIIIPTDDESNGRHEFEDTPNIEQQQLQAQQQPQRPQQQEPEDSNAEEDKLVSTPLDNLDKDKEKEISTTVENTNTSMIETLKEEDKKDKETEDILEAGASAATLQLPKADDNLSEKPTTSHSNQRNEQILEIAANITQIKPASQKNKEQKSDENSSFNQILSTKPPPPPPPASTRKLRERDRSESPMAATEDDTTTTSEHSNVTLRSRHRNSSTPLLDSRQSSPASSERDDRDIKQTTTTKRSLMNPYNVLMASKNAVALQRAYNEHISKFKDICKRNIDFNIIKRNIETGVIRNLNELQRDLLLFCQNAIMVFDTKSSNYKIACGFKQDCQSIKEFIANNNISAPKSEKESKEPKANSNNTSAAHSSGVKVRGSARKSLRIISN